MNGQLQSERIRELAEQAMESVGVEGLGGEYRELNLEKFAELIAADVREDCAKICDEGSSFDGDLIRARWWR